MSADKAAPTTSPARWIAGGAAVGLLAGLAAGWLQAGEHGYVEAGMGRSVRIALADAVLLAVPVGVAGAAALRVLWMAASGAARVLTQLVGAPERSARLVRAGLLLVVVGAGALWLLGPAGTGARRALPQAPLAGALLPHGRAGLAALLALAGLALAGLSVAGGLPGRGLLRGRRAWVVIALVAAGIAALEIAVRAGRAEGLEGAPNVVLVTVDTLRADHLGCYGYGRDTSPALDRLAADGVRFDRAYAQASWTLPSMASLHTSLLPSTHGLYEPTKRMSPGLTTLAELLREAGYETLAVVSHVFVARKHGFDQGFERFDEEFVLGHDGVSSEGLTGRALELLDGRSGRPFFLWVHYFDPHFTYVGHADHAFGEGYDGPLSDHVEFAPLRDEADSFTDADVQHVVDLYDAEIAHTDRWIGALLDGARERTAGEQTVVLFTADHGEAFRERGFFGHGKYCYDELARVPLVLGGDLAPELRGRTSRAIVETASLPRTIAELCGLDGSAFRGTSVLAHLRAGADGAGEPLARIETTYAWTDEDRRQAVVRGDWKLIRTQDDGSFELYHLGRDPGERTNLWGREDEDVRAAARDLLEQVSALPPLGEGRGGRVELADEDVEHLRALGYVDD